jgi:HEAT repeat protein
MGQGKVIAMRKTYTPICALALLCPLALAQTANLDDLLAQTAKWRYETSRQPLQALTELVAKAQGSPAGVRAIEQKFIAFLKSDATAGGKDFICKQLSVMGSEASVPVLAALLADPKTADLGRYALERIPGPGVDRALRETLAKTGGRTRIGIVNTLGVRRDAASVAALRPMALGAQPAEASAALFALAKIADPASLAVLSEAQDKTTGAVHADAAEAWLQAGNRLTERGNAAAAVPIFKTLYAAKDPGTVQAAALRGLANAGGAQAAPVLMEALRGNDARLQAIAIGGLMPGSAGQLIAEMPKLSEAAQVRILGLLAERGDGTALPAFTTALKGSSKPVRMAALRGIGLVGNASAVPVLAAIAAGDDTAEQAAARAALGRIPGKEADQAVADGIASAAPRVRLALIRAAGDRGAPAAAPVLLKMARDADPEVRRESLRALHDTGSANDIAGMVALVVTPVEAGDRSEAVKSLGAVLRRSDPSAIKAVVSAYTPARDPEARTALMQVMGQSGNAEALVILRAALNDPAGESEAGAGARRAAILALTEWPDVTPVPDLFATARSASNPAHQVLALRGALQLIALPAPSRPPRESVKMLAEAMGMAKQSDEKRAVLALLPKFPVREALDLANASVNDREVAAEAKAAVSRLERTVRNR